MDEAIFKNNPITVNEIEDAVLENAILSIRNLSRAVIPGRHLVGLPSTSSVQDGGHGKARPTSEANFRRVGK